MRIRISAMLVTICLVLAGCAYRSPDHSGQDKIVLPEPTYEQQDDFQGETGDERAADYILYYASADGTSLNAASRVISVGYGEDLLRRIVEELLEPASENLISPAPSETKLLSLENAGGLVTVNLSLEAMNTQDEVAALTMVAAIANTLLPLSTVDGINVLVDERQLSICSLPIGVITEPIGSIAAAYAQAQADSSRRKAGSGVSRAVALYFPDSSGTWLVPEIREISIVQDELAKVLVEQLQAGPATIPCASGAFPNDVEFLSGTPVLRVSNLGERILEINLNSAAFPEFSASGAISWVAAGALTLSVCSSCPEVDAVRICIDGTAVEAICLGDDSVVFPDGFYRAEDFRAMVGSTCTLYFQNDSGMLLQVERAVSRASAQDPGALLRNLLNGPIASELEAQSPFPQGITSRDLLGVRLNDGVASINLSANFYRLCQNLTADEERNTVYSMVNTLCELPNINGARIYVEGISAETLTQNIYLRSVLLPNLGLFAQ